jgi:hypothetical protein
MYFTKNRVNLYRFVPIFTIFMFRPLQKKIFLTDKILKKKFLQKSLLPCEKHMTEMKIWNKISKLKTCSFISVEHVIFYLMDFYDL